MALTSKPHRNGSSGPNSLLSAEPETIVAEGPPLIPLCRSLKRVLMPNQNRLERRACELDSLPLEGYLAR